jgi:tetratricopeptide (TPR) repeat protein
VKFFAIILPAMLALSPGWDSGNPAADNKLESGHGYYQAGQFSEAAAAYEKSAQILPSVAAYVNLGLTEWQRGHAGTAILAWERAQWIDPFNQQARQNLKLARSVSQVDEPVLKWYERASLWLPPNAWVWLAGASLWLTAGALTLPRFFRRPRSGWQQWLAALGFGVFLLCLAANLGVVSRTNLGFVVKRNAPLLLVPARTSEVITTLPAGEPARSLKIRGDYRFVRSAFGSGWIEIKDLGLVNGQ